MRNTSKLRVKVEDVDFGMQKRILVTDGKSAVGKMIDRRAFEECNVGYLDHVIEEIKEEFMATAYTNYTLQAELRRRVQEEQYQRYQQQAALQQSASSFSTGLATGGLAAGPWTTTTTSPSTGQEYALYVDGNVGTSATLNIGGETLDATALRKLKETYGKVKKVIRFFRVNKVVEINEGESLEPIDELRLKVARWLNPKENYNFA